MKSIRHYVYLNGKRYDWNEGYGDYIFAFTSKSGDHVVKRWREEVAKLNSEGAAQSVGDDVDRREAENEDFAAVKIFVYSDELAGVEKNRAEKARDKEMIRRAKALNIDASDGFTKAPAGVSELWMSQLELAHRMFGTIGNIEFIKIKPGGFRDGDFASFNKDKKTLFIRDNMGVMGYIHVHKAIKDTKAYREDANYFSTNCKEHIPRHEIGHALFYRKLKEIEKKYGEHKKKEIVKKLKDYHTEHFKESDDGIIGLSIRAAESYKEMVAESFAVIMNGKPNAFAEKILQILFMKEEKNDDWILSCSYQAGSDVSRTDTKRR